MGIKLLLKIPRKCPNCDIPTQECIPFCSQCGYDVRHHSFVKKRGKCIYCESIGPLSKEHVFGKWLTKAYPSAPKLYIQRLRRPDIVEIFPESPIKFHMKDLTRLEGNYQLKVRNVCNKCNNGWMSTLHSEAMALVKLLADGGHRKFTAGELETLSRWALMVSINLECHAHMLVTIRPHLENLMAGKMPMGWRVYIGQLPSNKHANFNHTRVVDTGMKIDEDFYQKVKNTAFCIEQVIFNTISTTGGDVMLEVSKYFAVSLHNPNPLTCIWHGQTQDVPENIAKVDDWIIDFVESFH